MYIESFKYDFHFMFLLLKYEKSSLAKGFRSLHINRKPLATKYVYKNTYTNENIAYLYGANKNTNKKKKKKEIQNDTKTRYY